MTGQDVLTARECWALLAAHDVGRVAFTDRALPSIARAGYTVVGGHLILRCRSEETAKLMHGQVVALEVDDIDGGNDGSRSVVVVTGRASPMFGASPHNGSTCPPDCEHRCAVRLEATRVVGHRLSHVA
jgi:nitroimidazol reductase NimA-like FMN-containing flavoprotein (pyridoxamine 5'-phosphate oxidase superfamily)